MLGKSVNQHQQNIFQLLLIEFIDLKNKLAILANKIAWNKLEKKLSKYYPSNGQPSKPIRLMTGLLMLKYLYNLSDEAAVERWTFDPYFQYFCGEAHFQWGSPCDPSDLSYFRKRIGKEGTAIIFQLSIDLHGKKALKSKEVVIDTTVQKKNITYPTDLKFYKKILDNCNKIAKATGTKLRQSYRFVVKKLMCLAYHKTQVRKSARKKLKTLAIRQLRDLKRVLSKAKKSVCYEEELNLYDHVLSQERTSKNKVYSLHEPKVSCIAKGKAHPRYEFGSKLSIVVVLLVNIIVGVSNYLGNPHDSKTLIPSLLEIKTRMGKAYERVLADKGYRGVNQVGKSTIIIPSAAKVSSKYEKEKRRKQNRRRSGIEAAISHLKKHHRLDINYLKGEVGDEVNALLGATAFNLKRLLSSKEFEYPLI